MSWDTGATKMYKQVTKCTGCSTPDEKGQWWGLNNYHGFSGNFCSKCYNTVAHDPYGKPKDPEALLFMALKLGVEVT